ncbi:Fucose 4-O-acetylase [Prevotella communis]|uniref:Fucose 4-O-acetylase n=2 Tax=Prevotella communis TaxID=2913614 RepID=A0A1G7VTM4_9BACT|nr:Fucose 4-O-acetylase [Prevotella communis]
MFHGNKSFKETIKKSFRRLIVPFVVFSLLGEIVYVLRMVLEHHPFIFSAFVKSEIIELVRSGYLIGNLPLWFLLSLFVIKFFFSIINNQIGRVVLLFVSLILSILMHIINPPILWLMNIPMGMFFYATGFFLSEKQYKKQVFFLSLICLLLIASFIDSEVSIVRLMTIFGNFYIWILYALVAVIVANNLSKWLFSHMEIGLLSSIGKNSMLLYVTHWPIFKLVHTIISLVVVSNTYIQLSVMTIVLFIIYNIEMRLINRYKLGYLIGI